MSLGLLLDISRQSFRALDAAMNVAGQNVANAETEGYSRRRLDLTSLEVYRGGSYQGKAGLVGAGVGIASFDRMRDSMLDHARWEARGTLHYADEQERVMRSVEALFPTGDASLQESVDQFWNAWSDLADHPTDVGVRHSLKGRAEALVSRLNAIDTGVDRIRRETNLAIEEKVTEANNLISLIGSLNAQIAHAQYGGHSDFAAMDRRDIALQRLSEMVPARFEEQIDGSTSVYIRGLQVVTQANTMLLSADLTGSSPQVTIGEPSIGFPSGLDTGEIGALLGPVYDDINNTRDKLNALTDTLVTEVNTLHQAGYGIDGTNGRDFFDPTGLAAGTIALSADVADPINIAASGDSAAQGDNSNALAIHDLRYALVMSGNSQNLSDYAVDIVSEIGSGVAAARARATGAEASVSGLDALADGVRKVNIDDEMVGLIKLQQAYAASARVLSTTDRMFEILLSI
ncbi:MAG: flagellar hook-associated protein FlgK [Rhodothermales bacterium]|nr:flagellar hook-associated protein FlgK [Rhodothermales bacterium]MBO6780479.1 flagellar hook-associated protein FlgK [Rhodothermales bacterium]